MRSATKNSNRGFSLIELLIALAVGVLVLGAAVQLFSKSVTATWLVSQRAELQERCSRRFQFADQRHQPGGRRNAFRRNRLGLRHRHCAGLWL